MFAFSCAGNFVLGIRFGYERAIVLCDELSSRGLVPCLAYLLRHLRARQGLRAADRRQRLAELLRGEDAKALLLHGLRVLLASGALLRLANRPLLSLRLLEFRLRVLSSLFFSRDELIQNQST